MRGAPHSRLAWLATLVAGLSAAVFSGCSAPGAGRHSSLGQGPLPGVVRRVRLLARPSDVREDCVYPPGATRQTFAWDDEGGVWRVRFPPARTGYAGFAFPRHRDFSARRDATVLSLRVRPTGLGNDLSVVLVGPNPHAESAWVEALLAPHWVWRRRGWDLYAVRLSDFGGPHAASDPSPGEDGSAAFDWARVAGVRLVARSPRMWPEEGVAIRDLQFGPIPWALRFQPNPFSARAEEAGSVSKGSSPNGRELSSESGGDDSRSNGGDGER